MPKWPLVVAAIALSCCLSGSWWWNETHNKPGHDVPAASTCREWSDLDSADQLAKADAMLTALRDVDGLSAPRIDQVRSFRSGVTRICSANVMRGLSDVAASLYLTERARFGS